MAQSGIKVTQSKGGLKVQLQARLENVAKGLGRSLNDEVERIVERGSKGQVLTGLEKPYSIPYARLRYEHGREIGFVDHHVTGNMLSSIQFKVEREGSNIVGTIFPTNTSSISPFDDESASAPDKVRWTDALRHWYGLSKIQKDRIVKAVRDAFSRGT